MPDGELTGIGIDVGSPLYPPPSNLPADWLSRLVPAAKAAIPIATFEASMRNAMARFVVRFVGLPDDFALTLPADLQQWGSAVVSGLIGASGGDASRFKPAAYQRPAGGVRTVAVTSFLAIVLGLACGVSFGAMLGFDIMAWYHLVRVSFVPANARLGQFLTAMVWKVGATVAMTTMLFSCEAAAGASLGLAAAYVRVIEWGVRFFLLSAVAYSGLTLGQIIAEWL
jgi:hypothetical protein